MKIQYILLILTALIISACSSNQSSSSNNSDSITSISVNEENPVMIEMTNLHNQIAKDGPINMGDGMILLSLDFNSQKDTVTWKYEFEKQFNGINFDKEKFLANKEMHRDQARQYAMNEANVVQSLKEGLVYVYYFYSPDKELLDRFIIDKSLIGIFD